MYTYIVVDVLEEKYQIRKKSALGTTILASPIAKMNIRKQKLQTKDPVEPPAEEVKLVLNK